uniref:Uncharacterized protein n=1 Tax=OCS116 cluster bacterium TaxID=2030921 RepID=A0A2A4YUN8_9PROT
MAVERTIYFKNIERMNPEKSWNDIIPVEFNKGKYKLDEINSTFCNYVIFLLKKFKKAELSIIRNVRKIDLIDYSVLKNGELQLHLSVVTPDDGMTTKKKLVNEGEDSFSTISAPEGSDFLEGELFVRIHKDKVFILHSNCGKNVLKDFIIKLSAKLKIKSSEVEFFMMSIANKETLKQIASEGVQWIQVKGHTTSDDKGNYWENKTSNSLLSYFTTRRDKDKKKREFFGGQRLQIKIMLDKRGDINLQTEELKHFSENMANEENTDYKIKTLKGNFISPNQITYQKVFRFDFLTKKMNANDVWESISNYYIEIKNKIKEERDA